MRSLDVSVVIPTYNRAYILFNTLTSLKYQTYPHERFEVIVVDDGSTDNTEALVQKVKIENLTFIRLERNMGDGVARNKGVSAARGELIIFCDSDFIVRPTHIASHVNAHKGQHCLAVSGLGHWEYLLTFDYGPKWAAEKGLIEEYTRPFIKKRLEMSRNRNLITEGEIQRQELEPFRVTTGNALKKWTSMFDEITEKYGYSLEGFQCPWLSFCTGNVSIRRDIFLELGCFDEQMPRMKDLELGFRFFLAGGNFRYSREAEAFMQITDIESGRNAKKKKAFKHFARKHNALEVHLMGLDLLGLLNYHELSLVVYQHYHLKTEPRLRAITYQFENMAGMLADDGKWPPLQRYLPPPLPFSPINTQYHEIQNNPEYAVWLSYYNKLMHGMRGSVR